MVTASSVGTLRPLLATLLAAAAASQLRVISASRGRPLRADHVAPGMCIAAASKCSTLLRRCSEQTACCAVHTSRLPCHLLRQLVLSPPSWRSACRKVRLLYPITL